jgi:predicted phosphodiesterase
MGIVGIIADSHGEPEAIAAALAFLRGRKCRRIYHLGDICDSSSPDTAETCVRLLQENGVIAVKGNNDHAVVANQLGRNRASISQTTYAYLQDLPSVAEYQGAFFTHSRPFVRKLGLSSMIGEMSKNEAGRFFKTSPRGILFRGHGHSPAIIWQDDHHVVSQILTQGQKVDLSERLPCVVTCGALTEGHCMVWQPENQHLTCLCFLPPVECHT